MGSQSPVRAVTGGGYKTIIPKRDHN